MLQRMIRTLTLLCVMVLPLMAQGGTIGGGGGGVVTAANVSSGTFPSGTYNFTGATTLTGGAGSMTLLAGTGASRRLVLQTTTSGSTATTALRFNELQQALATQGLNTLPGYSFAADSTSGIYHQTSGSTHRVQISVDAGTVRWACSNVATEVGCTQAGGQTFGNAGVGVGGPSFSWQSSPTTGFYRVGADTIGTTTGGTARIRTSAGSTTFLSSTDTLRANGKMVLSGLTAEGSTQSSVCVTAGGGEVFINAAATCTVSSLRFKKNVAPFTLREAQNIVTKVRPVSFNYKQGNRAAIGVIAEQADSVDSRLTVRDPKGRVNSVNYEQLTVALLRVVTDLQRQVDSIKAARP